MDEQERRLRAGMKPDRSLQPRSDDSQRVMSGYAKKIEEAIHIFDRNGRITLGGACTISLDEWDKVRGLLYDLHTIAKEA